MTEFSVKAYGEDFHKTALLVIVLMAKLLEMSYDRIRNGYFWREKKRLPELSGGRSGEISFERSDKKN